MGEANRIRCLRFRRVTFRPRGLRDRPEDERALEDKIATPQTEIGSTDEGDLLCWLRLGWLGQVYAYFISSLCLFPSSFIQPYEDARGLQVPKSPSYAQDTKPNAILNWLNRSNVFFLFFETQCWDFNGFEPVARERPHESSPDHAQTSRTGAFASRSGSRNYSPPPILARLLDLCVSSLRRGHANLLCTVPISTDDPRRIPPRASAFRKPAFPRVLQSKGSERGVGKRGLGVTSIDRYQSGGTTCL